MHPIQVLERYWQHTSFRPLQEEIITSVLNNEDTFALLPTGGGKSICFQIPALIKEGICIVISPLIALMKDQVHQLKQKGIKAIALTSGMSLQDLDTQLDNCIYGNYKFLYISPERLQQSLVKDRIQQMNVNLIAVDEAHCISQWGNDFRPAYSNIIELRQIHPHIPCIALTATAKERVVDDIIKSLDLLNPKVFKASFQRPNISYNVLKVEDKLFHLEHLLTTKTGSAIIYARSRKATVDISEYLNSKGFEATFYHGGITNKEKQNRLLDWTNNRVRLMVATTAFGMGIDKADVQSVIHYNLPESLESYFQEAGRAGRNGKPADATILTKEIDASHLKGQFLGAIPSVDFVKLVYRKLCNYFQVSYGEGQQSQYQLNFLKFCETYDFKVNTTYNTLKILDRNSIISFNERFNYKTKVQIIVPNASLFQYLETQPKLATPLKALLRTYGGIFDFMTKIDLNTLSIKANVSEKAYIHVLKQLQKDNILDLELANTDSEITFIVPREDEKTINPIAKTINQQSELKHNQVNAVLNYINNDLVCRSEQLLQYFGESSIKSCGICSVCMSKNSSLSKNNLLDISNLILEKLQTMELSSRQLLQEIDVSESELLLSLSHLLEQRKIKLSATNTYLYVKK